MFEQRGDVASGVFGLQVRGGDQFVRVVQRIVAQFPPGPSSQQVDHFVFCDRVQPRRERLVRLIRMALIMNGKKRLLNQILHLVRRMRQTPLEKGTQVRAQIAEKRMVRSCVTR